MSNTNDGITVNIKEAAKLIDVTPATIRNWEKHGLVAPVRLKNGYRAYSSADIERLQKIKKYSIEDKMSISAIKILLNKDYQYKVSEGKETVTKKMLGKKWKQHRLEKGLSINEVAVAIGITPSYLFKIENSQANPSFNILEKLATFYGENVLFYFQNETSNPMSRTGKTEKFSIGLEGVILTARNTLESSNLKVMTYTIQPGCGRKEHISHHGEEFIFVLDGQVNFFMDSEKYELKVGDSLHFHSTQKHKWINPSKTKTAKMLWVYTFSGS